MSSTPAYSPLLSVWAFRRRRPNMPAADSCTAVNGPYGSFSPEFRTPGRPPEVSSTAFATRLPDLPPRTLMAMDFAIIGSLVRPGRPHIWFLFVRSWLCYTLPSDPASRRRPCVSLALHHHQVGQGTRTPKLLRMLGAPKKSPVPRGNRADRMEQSSRRVECLQTYNHLTCKAIAYVYCNGNFYRSTASFELSIQFTSKYHCMWAGPRYFLLLAATPFASRACSMHCALHIASTANCELRTADYFINGTVQIRHEGKSHRWSSVICRSMEKSVGAHPRMQLREARDIGGLIWRIDVTTGFSARRATHVNRV
ncbi:hypothetical protein QF002_007561 [Paraburkholderia youngii]